jgi:hypothetical protein
MKARETVKPLKCDPQSHSSYPPFLLADCRRCRAQIHNVTPSATTTEEKVFLPGLNYLLLTSIPNGSSPNQNKCCSASPPARGLKRIAVGPQALSKAICNLLRRQQIWSTLLSKKQVSAAAAIGLLFDDKHLRRWRCLEFQQTANVL